MTLIGDCWRRWRRTDRTLTVLIFGVLLYLVRVLGPGWKKGFPSFFPDSASYLRVAKLGPFRPSFWFTERPTGVPLMLWLTAFNSRAFVLLQTLIFALSIAFLCHTILHIMKVRPLAWLTCTSIAAIAIQPRFGIWNLEVLSESLGMSLSVIALTCWLRASQHMTTKRLWIATIATVAWMLVRDSHGIPALILVLALAIFAWRVSDQAMRKTLLKCVGVLLLAFSYISIAQAVSNRNQYPLMNNIGLRILPDQAMTNHFVDRGMPTNETLVGRVGRNTWDDGEIFLKSPDLIDFRKWVNGSGQTDQLVSLAIDAPFWIDVMRKELPVSLAYDFHDYDRFQTLDRLPAQTLGFDTPRTTVALNLWLLTGVTAITGLFFLSKSRKLAIVSIVALSATLVELYASIAGDAVEVQRHLIGPIMRLSVVLILATAFAIEMIYLGLRHRQTSATVELIVEKPRTRFSAAFAQSALAIIALGALITNELRSQDFDPQYTKTMIERAARFGGTYYQNGIHNKGPLETALYDSARIFTSQNSYWFGISFYVLAISLILSLAVASVARMVGSSKTVAFSAAVLVFLHFSVSSSDYAGVIYSRNMTTCVLAFVFAVMWWAPAWSNVRRSQWTYVASFVLLGLAVQTLLTTVFAAVVIGVTLVAHRRRATQFERPMTVAIGTFTSAILTAPVWYLLRGSFNEFWSGWWTYAGFMSAGTGRSLMNQLGLGWNQFVGYYQERPLMLILVIAFVFSSWYHWRSLAKFQQIMHVSLALWFVCGWIELVLGQRYSSHYFSVLAVPNVFMGAILMTQLETIIANRGVNTSQDDYRVRPLRFGLPIATAVIILFSQCSDQFWTGVQKLGTFTTISEYKEERTQSQGGEGRTARAIIDLVSREGDPLLAWTMYPWTYLEHERVPATRFSWKSFMLGEIYLGQTSLKYVLPDTWDWFAQDVDQTRPRAYMRPKETALNEQTPFAQYVTNNYTLAYDGNSLEVRLLKDDWAKVLSIPLTAADIDSNEIFNETSPFVLSEKNCVRIAGTLSSEDSKDEAAIIFNLTDPTQSYENVHLSLSPTRSSSSSDNVEFAAKDFMSDAKAPVHFLVVVGKRSAVLIVDGEVVSATRLGQQTQISVALKSGQPTLSNLRIDAAPMLNGCASS
jgi:hypothetical protein